MQVTYITLFYQNAIYFQTENHHKLLGSQKNAHLHFFSKKLFLTLNHDFLCEIVLFTSSDIFPYNFRYEQLVRIWVNPLGGYFFKHPVILFSLIYNENAQICFFWKTYS